MIVHLIDGTYDPFRHFYGAPLQQGKGSPLGAVVGVLNTVLEMIEKGATHLGVATDHVIESSRNELWDDRPGVRRIHACAGVLGREAIAVPRGRLVMLAIHAVPPLTSDDSP